MWVSGMYYVAIHAHLYPHSPSLSRMLTVVVSLSGTKEAGAVTLEASAVTSQISLSLPLKNHQ